MEALTKTQWYKSPILPEIHRPERSLSLSSIHMEKHEDRSVGFQGALKINGFQERETISQRSLRAH